MKKNLVFKKTGRLGSGKEEKPNVELRKCRGLIKGLWKTTDPYATTTMPYGLKCKRYGSTSEKCTSVES